MKMQSKPVVNCRKASKIAINDIEMLRIGLWLYKHLWTIM